VVSVRDGSAGTDDGAVPPSRQLPSGHPLSRADERLLDVGDAPQRILEAILARSQGGRICIAAVVRFVS
jgi:hypothetical protein